MTEEVWERVDWYAGLGVKREGGGGGGGVERIDWAEGGRGV